MRLLRRLGLAVALGTLLGPVALAAPASAHGADAPAATDYRVTVLGVTGAVPGLTVRAVEAGARLELVNHGPRTIEVLGYSGEPYLRVGPDGAYQNDASPATYLNETLTGGVAPPSSAGPAMPPLWTKLSSAPAVLWHDHRTQPAAGTANPATSQRLLTWSVPLRDGVRQFAVTGTLDVLPRPSTPTWWAGCLLLAAAVAALGLWGLRSPSLGAILAGLAGILYAAGVGLDSGYLGAAGFVRVVLAQQTWPLVCGVAAVAAGVYGLLRRPAADLALGLSGACLAIFAGIGNAAVFAHSVTPSIWPGTVSRLLVVATISGGAGVAVAAVTGRRRHASRSWKVGAPIGAVTLQD